MRSCRLQGLRLALATLLPAGALAFLAAWKEASGPFLTVYCAAGLRPAVEEAASRFEERTGIAVRLDSGSSGELAGKMRLERHAGIRRCDLYLPADPWFLEEARRERLAGEAVPLARNRIVLAFRPGEPPPAGGLEDLPLRQRSLALCNQQAGAGRRTRMALEGSGLWERIQQGRPVAFLRVGEAAAAVRIRPEIGAALIWESTARQFGLAVLRLPELAASEILVSAGVAARAPSPEAARAFLDDLADPQRGGRFLRAHHFGPPGEGA